MKIELLRERPKDSGAVHGRVFVDGVFFAYSLENKDYMFPNGIYNLYGKKSPSFGTNKVYIDVPNRSNIMFHGANSADQLKGCVAVGAEREGDTIKGDQSNYLYDVVDMAGREGEPVGLVVKNDNTKMIIAVGLGILGVIYFFSKR